MYLTDIRVEDLKRLAEHWLESSRGELPGAGVGTGERDESGGDEMAAFRGGGIGTAEAIMRP